MLSSPSIWALFLSYACRAYTMYFFNTWFFIYLVRVRGLTIMQGGLGSATPFLAVLLLSPIGGLVSDLAVRHFGKRRGRQTAVWLGMACSATLVWIGCYTADNTVAILLVASAAGFNMFANVSWWATCIDLTPISPLIVASMPCTAVASPATVVTHGTPRLTAAVRIS